MRHIRAAINLRDLALERGRQSTRSSPEVCLQKASGNLRRISRHFLETRGSPGKPGPLKDRERHGTGDLKTRNSVNGTQISSGKFPPGKRDYLFRSSTFSGNFPVGRTKKSCSIYIPTGISGIFGKWKTPTMSPDRETSSLHFTKTFLGDLSKNY